MAECDGKEHKKQSYVPPVQDRRQNIRMLKETPRIP